VSCIRQRCYYHLFGGARMKHSEKINARHLAIMESAHDMIATFDPRGKIRYLNRAGYRFLGIANLQGKNGQLETYMSEATTIRLIRGLRIALEQGFWQDESEWITKSGEIRITSQTVVAHPSADGGEPYYSTISRDITERKEIERQLLLAKQAADEANETKSRFLVRMSHEIRTPLNGIIGLTHLLQRTGLSDVQRDYLRLIATSSSTMMHILNDILDFSRIASDKLTIENAPFQLDEMLERLSGTFAVLIGPKPIDMIIYTEPNVPEIAHGDHARLEQVLLNLVGNAIKFTENGSIRLHISLSAETEERCKLKFAVADTGIGMTPEQLDSLFVPFVQASAAASRISGGSGLGLAISQALIRRMGGDGVQVASQYGEGTTFSFELEYAAERMPIGSTVMPTGMRVLILEDSEIMREHWMRTMSQLGCHTRAVSTWEHARRLMLEEKWDVWIADMEADDMYGEATWAEWKSEADACGVATLCSTSLYGRDALMSLPERLRPAGVLLKPAVRQRIAHALLSLKDYKNPEIAAAGQPDAVSLPQLQGRVLVAEDDPISRTVMAETLKEFGLEVDEAVQGTETLHLLERQSYHLLLMDFHLQDMNGLELMKRIRQNDRWNELPIIVVSGEQEQSIWHLARQAGMNEQVSKPVEPNALFRLLAKWLPPAEHLSKVGRRLWSDSKLLDIPHALHRLDGKVALYLRLLERFSTEYADLPVRLRALCQAGDADTLHRLLHSFRGAAAHLGANAIASDAFMLEEACRLNEPTQELQVKLDLGHRQLMVEIAGILRQKK